MTVDRELKLLPKRNNMDDDKFEEVCAKLSVRGNLKIWADTIKKTDDSVKF